ncbi:MAG: hypothetical protein U9Q78_05435 [Chloroflexota bacterium]|nr:hypothetical protein [Chloroflexota bacterium]
MAETIENLDFYCVDYAKRVVDDLITGERALKGDDVAHIATKLLSVLHENGPYAALLYILWKRYNGTRTEKRVAAQLEDLLIGKPGQQTLLRLPQVGLDVESLEDTLQIGRRLATDLDRLFLAKDLLDRTLIYVRYHARGMATP